MIKLTSAGGTSFYVDPNEIAALFKEQGFTFISLKRSPALFKVEESPEEVTTKMQAFFSASLDLLSN